MDPMSASAVYGFQSAIPISPGTQDNAVGSTPSYNDIVQLPQGVPHFDHPLFWLLILALIFTGYVFGVFEVGVKHIGDVKVNVGRD